MKLKEALAEIRKNTEKRKFDQSVDLIVNFKGIDPKRDNVNVIANLPNKIKEKKICGFFTSKSKLVDTITEPEFIRYKDKAALKKLVKKYDFFIAVAPLMPKVATAFGKVLGPAGKMPSPQLGILMKEDDAQVQALLDRISSSVKLRAKEASLKLSVGKESMDDEKIVENVKSVYGAILNALPNKVDNVKNIMVKLSMGKPVKTEAN
jgi:large subunit ribosomal protein L1